MFKAISTALLLRRIVTALDRLVLNLDRQTLALDRLADRFAPQLPEDRPADRATVRAESGVSHLDVDEAARALAYIRRTEADTGHTPDEDEILIHLGDEATRDLGQRLAQRDVELTRLMEARR